MKVFGNPQIQKVYVQKISIPSVIVTNQAYYEKKIVPRTDFVLGTF